MPDDASADEARRDARRARDRRRRRRETWRSLRSWRGRRQPPRVWYLVALAIAIGAGYGLLQARAGGDEATPTLVGLAGGIAVGAILGAFAHPLLMGIAFAVGVVALAPLSDGTLPAALLGAFAGIVVGAHLRAVARGDEVPEPRGHTPAAQRSRVLLVAHLVVPIAALAFWVVAILRSDEAPPWTVAVVASLAWGLPGGWWARQAATGRIAFGMGSVIVRWGVVVHALAAVAVEGLIVALTAGVFSLGLGAALRQLLDTVRARRARAT